MASGLRTRSKGGDAREHCQRGGDPPDRPGTVGGRTAGGGGGEAKRRGAGGGARVGGRGGLGASECAAALGLSPFETALGLWARKTGRVPEPEESEAMELGLLLEPVVAELYCRRTGLLLIKQQVFIKAGNGPLCATLDAVN